MRILILGGDGMLGHQLFTYLGESHQVRVTLRQEIGAYASLGLFGPDNAYYGVDVRVLPRVGQVLSAFEPEVVINAVGIVKQRSAAKDIIPSLEINALLPHQLAGLCKTLHIRLIHLSTDCVFSGKRGAYKEGDFSDAEDIYGRTKFLGEVHETHCLTLRTSIIGRELSRHTGLLDWFLSQPGPIKGFTNAVFTGFTTLEMSRIIEKMISDAPGASGVYHVSSDPINKYELLMLIREKLGHFIEIVPDGLYHCNRSLDSSRFRSEFNYAPPSWPVMIEQLRAYR